MINIHEFAERFSSNYSFLYDNNDNVAGYEEAVNAFDAMIQKSEQFKKFVGEFVKFRGDFISSDREAGAFMFALEEMGL